MYRMTKLAMSLIVVSALCLVPRAACAETPMTEAQFIELAGAPQPGDGGSGDTNRQKEAPKPAEEPKKRDDGEDPDDKSGSADDGAGSDGGDGGASDGDDDGDDGVGDDNGGDDGDDGDGEAAGDGDGDEGAGEPTAEENAAFRKALAEEGVDIKLEDIPEAARPLVEKKIKDLERGFHAKMRDLSEDQKAARAFRTEERFRRENPVDFIVSMLYEQPDLSDKVNARIEDLGGNETALEGHKALVEQARRKAADAEAGDDAKLVAHQQKIDNYIRIGRAAARAAGVPFEAGVEDAIAARLALGEELTEKDIQAIAKQKGSVYKRNLRDQKRRQSADYVKGKVTDHKKAGLVVPPGAGRAPAPAAKKMATSDEEFIEEFSSRGG